MALEFQAAGDEATAMQRAHEFGCLPETVLALTVLTHYRLVGSDANQGILQVEDTWPAAWRVQAARCHRALAEGCTDDIDVILRVFAAWQSSPNPDGWCSLWWVNPATLHRVEADTAAVFGSLASSGPLGMRRPVDPGRAPLVRKALADAFENAFFSRVGDRSYRPINATGDDSGESAPYVPSPAVLSEPGEQIIALGSDPGSRVIEHIITVDQGGVGHPEDRLAPLRDQWPVGSIVEVETLGSVSAGRMVINIITLHRGFPYPDGPEPAPVQAPPESLELLAAPTYPTAPIDGAIRMRVRVTGYRMSDDGQPVLIVDPLALDAPIDPAEHPDLATWDDIELSVRGQVSDHIQPIVELGRLDGYGSFFVPLTAGLSATDETFGARLAEGARFRGRVLPEPPGGATLTVSLLPEAVRHLETLPGIDNHRPVRAKVIKNEGAFGSVTVELLHDDPATGMSHRFVAERGRLMERFTPVVGDEVDVILRPDRSRERRRLPADRRLAEFVERNSESFNVTNGWLELAARPPDIASVIALLTVDDSPEWEREVVWLYEDNLHLEAALIGPAGDPHLAEIAATLPGFLVRDPQPSADPASKATDGPPDDATSADPSAERAQTAPAESALPPAPQTLPESAEVRRMVARLPHGAAARVHGPDGAALAELRAGPDVLAVVLADDDLTIIGRTGRSVRSVMAEVQRLILPAKGRLLLPPGGAKRLMGIDGTTLRALQVKTGCEAYEPDESDLWVVEGPSHAAVKEFLRLAAEQVPGVVGRVTDMEDAEVVVDDSVPFSEAEAIIAVQGSGAAPPPVAIPPAMRKPLIEDVAPVEPVAEETRDSRPAIKPLSRKSRSLNVKDRSERRAAKAEERARAKQERAEAKREKADAKAARKAAAATAKPSAEAEAQEPKWEFLKDYAEEEPIRPKERAARGEPSEGLKVFALVLAVVAVAAAVWYAATNFFGDDADSEVLAEPDATAAPIPVAGSGATFAPLFDASSSEPQACLLTIMATWTDAEQAASGVARLHQAGLPAKALNSDLVPNWTPARIVGAVAVETSTQADAVLERAGGVGFSGVTVDSTVDGCSEMKVVPAGASIGFTDVPVSHLDYSAILWLANTGLAEACNPPEGNQFCPDATMTRAELSRILSAALLTPPAIDPSNAPATVGDLNGVLNIGDTADTTPLTRASLATTLWLGYQTQG